jgi:ribonuclease J
MTRINELAGTVRVLILDSLYAPYDDFSKTESDARSQTFDLLDELKDKRAIVASTFGSHLYRLQTLCDLADKLNRKVVFIGRSLQRYINAGKQVGVVDLSSRGRMFTYAKQARRFLETLSNPEEYFLITTGHQGEKNAVLSRMSKGLFTFTSDDVVIFSCSTIPVPLNIENRAILESDLTQLGVLVIKDVHVSGHAHGKDGFDLLRLLKPDYFFPSHGEEYMLSAACKIAQDAGLLKNQIILAQIGKKYVF